MRKFFISLLVCCMSLGAFVNNVYANDDFANNEDTYYQMCSKGGLTEAEKNVCKLFQQYLNDKALERQNAISAAKDKLSDIKADLNATLKKIAEFDALIEEIEKEQQALELQIQELETNIKLLEEQIEAREKRIEEIDTQLRLRMYNSQAIMAQNKYLEYLMGASDFADLIRRISALNQLYSYDAHQMQLLEDEKALLQEDVANLQEQVARLEEQKLLLEKNKKDNEAAKAVQIELKARYLQEQATIEAQNRDLQAELNEVQSQIKDIANSINYIPPSTGWIYPIKESFYISAGAWYYPKSFGGGLHLGVDFAASKNKHVVSPANGVVAYVYDKCTSGGLGNGCGIPWGGGNQVLLIVQVGNSTYGILNCHMSKGIDVKVGDVIDQGTILGNVGNTGNSSGAHLHQEIYYLGSMSITQALKRYETYGVTFGTGWNTLSTTCDNRGAPFRMNPQNIYNVKVGYTYN